MFVHINSAPALAGYAAGDCPLAGYSVPDILCGVFAGGAAPDAGVSGAAPRSSIRAPVFQQTAVTQKNTQLVWIRIRWGDPEPYRLSQRIRVRNNRFLGPIPERSLT
jgi:hypothetical protein